MATRRAPRPAVVVLVTLTTSLLLGAGASSAPSPTTTKPVPLVQAVPQPYDQVSFQRDGVEIARYHFGRDLRRPFVFPVVGPSGRLLTRMGHPHDPESHSHHNSVWVAHNDVNGLSFWDDRAKGKIVHQRVLDFEDSAADNRASVTALNHWVSEPDGRVVLVERRRTQVQDLGKGEWLLTLDLQLEAPRDRPVTLGKTPFGLVGVRVAKSIGTNDGGGTIRNSEGAVNEKDVLWKRAKWVDYSGPVTTAGAVEGLTLMDHPANPNHPTYFHVRADGWMGTSLTYDEPRVIEPGKPLRLRYGLWVHAGMPDGKSIDARWEAFGKTEPADLNPPKK
jgi:hypothetical protein